MTNSPPISSPAHTDGAAASVSPFTLFGEWFEEAKATGMKEPSAVFLSTATRCGAPSCRIVLMKDFDEDGFVFYTNLNSRKGREINENPQAALCFYWQETGKQIRIEGCAVPVRDEEADAYFASRPLKSRIGAWASRQSEPMEGRGELVKRIAYYTARWATGGITRPPHWSGIRVVPDHIEFWRTGDNNMPERRLFRLLEGEWTEGFLFP